MASSFSRSSSKYLFTLILVFSVSFQNAKNCNAFKTFDFEIHHRFSDQVKAIMGADNLPEIGSPEYYAAMAHRDKVFHGRALAENDDDSKLLTLSDGVEDSFISSLGFLHYANISLGTPSLSFFVALDTGTKLLWVPCVQKDMNKEEISLNTYSMSSSSTSEVVTCNSSLCKLQSECSKSSSQCPYRVGYNANISSSGVLVEDVLRLKRDNHKPMDARITFGCGQIQTGFYLNGEARNGLFGLGIGSTSVPSILSSKGLVADSFSICFGADGVGRISFGDKGSSDQEKTPFNPMQQSPWYNITVTQLNVGGSLTDELDVTAIFYSGAEYTLLYDPAYTALCDSFDSQIDKRHSAGPMLGFEYCYHINTATPNVTFIMKGGSKFNVYYPLVEILNTDKTVTAYCLGVMKSSGGNFIGNNFMIGHNIVFNREKMVLGWKASNCTDRIVDSRNDIFPPFPAVSPASPPTINVQPPSVNDGAASPPIINVQPPSVNDGAASPPTPTTNVQPPSINGGTPRNGSNSNNAPQLSVGKPRNLYLIASSLLVLFLPILKIV
ncbi:hypothetical protein C5167_000129 [Papaver somniferum]|uniref:Peptidase A1 domain-containing protein n=1 Tax=Papaver somniferum TaxID=3469 RepID=A0A4Y7KV93_PAPSO|nr:aspartyl protease family protein 1-like [Papaver somniferum]RZC75849.1 hypothetical protein C5167_000129 [Papaver somniferum]